MTYLGSVYVSVCTVLVRYSVSLLDGGASGATSGATPGGGADTGNRPGHSIKGAVSQARC
jgi:hypothetical protein